MIASEAQKSSGVISKSEIATLLKIVATPEQKEEAKTL